MKQNEHNKQEKKSPEEILLVKMMDNMADGKYDPMWAIIIRKAIQHKVDINVVSKNRETPLIFAIKMHGWFLVNELLQAGTDVNAWDKQKHTALWHAVNEDIPEQKMVINDLLQHHAKIDAETVALAFKKNEELAVELLKEPMQQQQIPKKKYQKLRELAEKIAKIEKLRYEKIFDEIFDLVQQGVFSENKAFELLMDEKKATCLSRKSPRTLGIDSSKQRE